MTKPLLCCWLHSWLVGDMKNVNVFFSQALTKTIFFQEKIGRCLLLNFASSFSNEKKDVIYVNLCHKSYLKGEDLPMSLKILFFHLLSVAKMFCRKSKALPVHAPCADHKRRKNTFTGCSTIFHDEFTQPIRVFMFRNCNDSHSLDCILTHPVCIRRSPLQLH